MNFTRSSEINALDEKWYERFREIGSFQDYEYLTGKKEYRENQKKKFLSGEIENPELDYPELEGLKMEEIEKHLLKLKKEILKNENNDVIKKAYCWKINEKITEIRMLKAAKEGNDHKFFEYSKFIYGEPDRDICGYTFSQVRKIINNKLSSADADIKNAAMRLNAKIFITLIDTGSQISVKDYPFKKIISVKEEKEYITQEIKDVFEKTLNKYKLYDWVVVIDKERKYSGLNVSQRDKIINVPEGRKAKETDLKALIAHEIETHAVRRAQGERSRLKLLGLGLDRYIKGEEGVARYKEQKIIGNENFAGLNYYFAISLAMGADGKKRNFREVYELLKDFYFIRLKKANGKKTLGLSEKYAWNDCVRIFRGTTGKTPGACFMKDIVYREGNIGVWNVVKNKPEEIRRFSVGKYDPGNSRHIWILDQLGITEEDLSRLDEESLK